MLISGGEVDDKIFSANIVYYNYKRILMSLVVTVISRRHRKNAAQNVFKNISRPLVFFHAISLFAERYIKQTLTLTSLFKYTLLSLFSGTHVIVV